MSIGSIQKIDLVERRINATLANADILKRRIVHDIDNVMREGKQVLNDLHRARILEGGKGGGIDTFA